MSTEDKRREQVKAFFDRMEQDPRTPAELDALQAQARDSEASLFERLRRAQQPLTREQEAKLAEPLIRQNERTARLMSERLRRRMEESDD